MAIQFPDHTDPNNSPVEIDGRTYHWNGYGWELECGSGGGGTVDGVRRVYYGATPPTGPTTDVPTGSIFTQEDTLKVYVLQDDGTWVETTSCSGGGDTDLTAILNTINPFVTYDPSNITGDDIKIYYSSSNTYNIRPTTSYNVIGTYQQHAEIDVNGDGNWEDVDSISSSQLNTYSLTKGAQGGNNYLIGAPQTHGGTASDPTSWANPNFPNILVRYWTENIVNDRAVKVYTGEISPYVQTHSYP